MAVRLERDLVAVDASAVRTSVDPVVDLHVNAEEAQPQVLESPASPVAHMRHPVASWADRSLLDEVPDYRLDRNPPAVDGPFDSVGSDSCDIKALQIECGSAILVHGGYLPLFSVVTKQ